MYGLSAFARTQYDRLNPGNNHHRVATPDIRAYMAVIQAHAESGTPDSAQKALPLLNKVLQSTDPHLIPDACIFQLQSTRLQKQAAKNESSSGKTPSRQ